MKNKIILTFIIALTVAILLLIGFQCRFKKVGKSAVHTTDFTETILPVSEQTAFEKIQALSYGTAGVNRGVKLGGKFNNFWLSDVRNSDNIGEDYQLRTHSEHNPALQRYLEIKSELRNRDFYLLPPPDFYWPSSEYIYIAKHLRSLPVVLLFIYNLQVNQQRKWRSLKLCLS